MPVTERDLILPALRILNEAASELSTTEMSQNLREAVKPQGEDLEILAGRNDDKFSQKVRNLRSHQTLENPGYATYEKRGAQGYWKISEDGRRIAMENEPLAKIVLDPGFDSPAIAKALKRLPLEPETPKRKALVFDENALIVEGGRSQADRTVYQRSRLLRDRIVSARQAQGRLKCDACDFDFEEVYGELGQGFIEVHHIVPIFCLEGESVVKTVEEAKNDVAALCSNCHRMIHRRCERMISVNELKETLKIRKGSA